MGKIIFSFVLFVSLFFSGLTASAINPKSYSVSEKNLVLDEPVEIGREYVLIGDQWYLIIYYSEGPIKMIPVTGYGLD
jgi:hypothetical protein